MRAYKANMIPGGTTPTINVSQYDNDYAVTVTLIEGAEIYTPPVGATIRVEGTKPDGHGFEYPCTYQDNVVTMPIYTQMTAVAGRFPIELVVYQSGLRVGSCNIIFAVERAPLGEGTDISETVIPDIIAGAQAQADAAAASATQAASSAASAETAKTAAMDAAHDAIDAAQELQTAIQFNAALIHETASGAFASFADGADDIPMQSVVAEITPVQSGSGDPSPDNIRPISGRTGLTVTRAGRNLFNGAAVTTTSNGITFTANADGSITANGTATGRATLYVPFSLIAGDYILSGCPSNAVVGSNYWMYFAGFAQNVGAAEVRKTLSANVSNVNLAINIADGVTVNNLVFRPMIRLASISDDTYEPYTAQTIPITWESIAGTVYGGTLDVVSGVLTVDRGFAELSEDWAWRKSSSYPGGYIVDRGVVPGTAKLITPFVCSHAKTVTRIADYVFGTCYCDSSMNFRIMGESSTLQDWKDYIAAQRTAGTPVQICYYLATPQTYQLTPTEVRTILGGNTIYTDAGDVSVEYIADTKLYIDNKIAALQALILEN